MMDGFLESATTPHEMIEVMRVAMREAASLLVTDTTGHLVFRVRMVHEEGNTVGIRIDCPTLIRCLVGDLHDFITLDLAQRSLLRTPGGRAYAVTSQSTAVFERSADGHWVTATIRLKKCPGAVDMDLVYAALPPEMHAQARETFVSWWPHAHEVTLRCRVRVAE